MTRTIVLCGLLLLTNGVRAEDACAQPCCEVRSSSIPAKPDSFKAFLDKVNACPTYKATTCEKKCNDGSFACFHGQEKTEAKNEVQ